MKPYTLSLLFIALVFTSCTNDELPEPTVSDCPIIITYIDDIKEIVDNSCAYEGCHVSGFGSGDFSSFAAMQGSINSGSFENRVVNQRNMPPSYAPADRPMELTAEELDLVKCWIQGGYTE